MQSNLAPSQEVTRLAATCVAAPDVIASCHQKLERKVACRGGRCPLDRRDDERSTWIAAIVVDGQGACRRVEQELRLTGQIGYRIGPCDKRDRIGVARKTVELSVIDHNDGIARLKVGNVAVGRPRADGEKECIGTCPAGYRIAFGKVDRVIPCSAQQVICQGGSKQRVVASAAIDDNSCGRSPKSRSSPAFPDSSSRPD